MKKKGGNCDRGNGAEAARRKRVSRGKHESYKDEPAKKKTVNVRRTGSNCTETLAREQKEMLVHLVSTALRKGSQESERGSTK